MRPQFFKIGFIFMILIGIVCGSSGLVFAQDELKQVLIIDVPRLTFADFQDRYPNLYQLLNQSAVGIMAMPVQEPVKPEKVYYELNSGSSFKIIEEAKYFLNTQEDYQGMKAGDLYRSLTGFRPPVHGAVNIGYPKVLFINNQMLPDFGLAGQVLHQHSIKTAVIGNSDDDPLTINRPGAALFMDEKGQIDLAAVGNETMLTDPRFPFGKRTDPEQIVKFWNEFKGKAQVVVITLGDLERINEFSKFLPEPRLDFHRRQALKAYDHLLGKILSQTDLSNTLVMVFSVIGPDTLLSGKRLNPVIIRKPMLQKGLLYSNSTRRASIVTGYDLMVTVFDFLGIKKPIYPKGRPVSSREGDWSKAVKGYNDLIINYDVRWPLLTVYGYLFIGLIVILVLGMIFWRDNHQFFQWCENIYLFFLTFPMVFLIEALVNPVNWGLIITLTLSLSGLLFAILYLLNRRNQKQMFFWISLLTTIVVVLDGLFNGSLQLNSFLGYSAVAGVRFYGIGNEYMGFLIGAYISLLSIGLSEKNKINKPLLWAGTVFVAVILAHPNFGANIGGGITALTGIGVTNFLLLKKPVGLRELCILAGSAVLLLIFIGIWDLSLDGRITHFGEFIQLVNKDGISAVKDLIYRKWQMNLNIIEYTPLSKVLIALLLIVPFFYKKQPQWIVSLAQKYPFAIKSFFGLVFTAIVALIVNDSGIVSVATIFIFGINLILLIMINRQVTPGVESNE